MRTRLSLLAGMLLLIFSTGFAGPEDFQIDVKEHVLENGMTILVLENSSAPTFSAIIRFNTGSADEMPGITGISHLLEHMMFKGTRIFGTSDCEAEIPIMKKIDSLAELMIKEQVKLQNPLNLQDSTRYNELRQQIADLQTEQKQYVIKDELWSTYLKHGGTSLNASTGNDGTNYYVSLPKNKLEMWAFMEADRMQNIILREFYSERDVVMEERRLRTENEPTGKLNEALNATMFWASPYKWPVVGWMSDLRNIMREDAEEYFRIQYAPGNAVAAVVGDVKAEEVFELCEKYFGKIPAQPMPPPIVSYDAQQEGERRIEIEHESNPRAYIAWNTPQLGNPDVAALEFAASILSRGRTSRFYINIKERKLGNVYAYVSSGRLPDAFFCSVTPLGDHTIQELENAIYEEIDRLKTEPISEWELQKFRNQMDVSLVRSLNSNMGMARRLSSSKILTGDWSYFIKEYEEIKKVTPADILRVVNKYLVKKNRTVVYITQVKPESRAEEEPESYSGGDL